MSSEELRIGTIEIKEERRDYALISVEPLERGYGVTIGNALRRVLLSSIEGSSISAFRIVGVVHEFSTIPGVREDVVNVMLNLKKIYVRSYTDDVRVLSLEVTGPKVVKAADISPDSQVEIINPEAYICTVNEGYSLSMELYVESGRGYKPYDRPRPSYLPVDAILTDALFSPVLRVNYWVEASRVGRQTDYERLMMEIWTNGAVSPMEALRRAGDILVSCFAPFSNVAPSIDSLFASSHGEASASSPSASTEGEDLFSKSIKELELSVRSENCLLRAGIKTIGDLVSYSKEDLLGVKNLGRVSLKEIEEKLAAWGLELRSSKKR